MNPDKQLELKKTVWAYLIEKGQVTDGEWSYYGSGWNLIDGSGKQCWDYEKAEKHANNVKNRIKNIGVNWDLTEMPESVQNSCFNGTFAESSKAESLLGTIVLNNDERYIFGVDNAETRMSVYIAEVIELIRDTERVKNIFGE